MMWTVHGSEVIALWHRHLVCGAGGRLACRIDQARSPVAPQAGSLCSFMQVHRREHRLSVVGEVSALFVQALAGDVRRSNAVIAGSELGFFRELFQFFG